MAGHDAACAGVKQRPVKGMSDLADQPVDRVAWQPGVGVERNDVAYAFGHLWGPAADFEKTSVGRAAQQLVQLVQLATLAFPADPTCFAGIPNALAVQQ